MVLFDWQIRWGIKWRKVPFIYIWWLKRRSSTVKRSRWATTWKMPYLVPMKAVPTWKIGTAVGQVWPPPICLTCHPSKRTEGEEGGGPTRRLLQKPPHLQRQFKSPTFRVLPFPLCLWHLLHLLRLRLRRLKESNVLLRSWSSHQYSIQARILLMDLQISTIPMATHQPNKNSLHQKIKGKW